MYNQNREEMLKLFALFCVYCLSINYICCENYLSYPTPKFTPSTTNPGKINVRQIGYSCPAETEEEISNLQKVLKHAQNFRLKYCLFRKPPSSANPKTCQTEVRPLLVPRINDDKQQIRCGSDSSQGQNVYLVGFYLCGDFNQMWKFDPAYLSYMKIHLKIWVDGMYDVCYDKLTNRTVLTKHTIDKPHILVNSNVKDEALDDIEINLDPFDLPSPPFLEMKNKYDLEKQRNLPQEMQPYPLVPPQHIAYLVSKKSTHHILNMAPLWKPLTALMFAIDEGLKVAQLNLYKKNPKSYEKLIIYTKVVPIAETIRPDKSLFPHSIWYKFVYSRHKNQGVLIRIYNTPEIVPKTQCPGVRVTCTFTDWIKGADRAPVIANEALEFAYCCETSNEEIRGLFSERDVKIEDILNLDRLVYLSEKPEERPDRRSKL